MSKLFFYNSRQNPSDGHTLELGDALSCEVNGLVSTSLEMDDAGNNAAYVEDIGVQLEPLLLAGNVSIARVGELLNCELITTTALCF